MKKWQKSIASVLAVAMLVSNFGSVTPMINAQSIETNDVNITEETSTVDTVIRLDDTEVKTDDEIIIEEPTTSEDDGVTNEDASTVEDKDVTDEVVGDLPSTEIESETYTLTIHYNRENGDYDGWGIHNWGSGINDDQKEFTHKDDFGYLVDIEVVQGSEFGYIIKDTDWNKNHPEDQLITVTEDTEIWVEQGQNGYHTEAPNGLTGDRVELEKPTPPEPSETRKLTLHYNRENNDYEGWDLWFWPKGGAAEAKPFIGSDEFGLVIELALNMGEEYNYIIRKDDWSDKNYPEDQKIIISEDTEIWVEQGQNGHYKVNPKEPFLTIHYNRTKADYEGWDLWWFPEGEEGHSVSFNGMDDFGLVAEIPVDLGSEYGYIIRKNDWSDKNHGSDQIITITEHETEIWVEQGQDGFHTSKPDLSGGDKTPIDLIVHYARTNGDYQDYIINNWALDYLDEQIPFTYVDAYGAVTKIAFNSLQDLNGFEFKLSQPGWQNEDGNNKKVNIDSLQVIKNVDRYAAHIYVKQGLDDIYYSNPNKEVSEFSTVTVHYNRTDKDYTGWNLWTWATGVADGRIDFEYEDDFGYLAEFQVKTGNTLGYLVRKSETGNDWADKNFDADQQLVIHGDTEIWIEQGQNGFHSLSPNGQTGDRVELPEAPSDDLVSDEEADMQVFVHYFRYLEDYRNWNTWAWADGVVEGHGYSFTKSDEFGRIAKINLKDIEGLEKLGFIIRRGEWSEKDVDMDRFFDLTKAKHNPETDKLELNVYLLQDDPNVYYSAEEIDKTPPLKTATFNKTTQLIIKAPFPFEDKDGVLLENSEGNAVPIISSELSKDKRTITVTLENEIEMGQTYYVSKTGFRGKLYVEYYGMFDSQEFHDKFTYTGNDLGAIFTESKTDFRVWAPTASKVSLRLYKEGHTDSLIKEVEMTKDINGTWIATEIGNLHKTYYTYVVTVGNNTNEAADPYARAVGVNGQRAMVVNLDATDPSGWESDKNPEFSGNITDAIIYELHLRDLSSSSTSGISNVGKFLQLTEKGTKSDKGVATGLDHLVEMGITHLHLLPAFDHRSIDETKLETPQFNWGYDPQNYNVPEGSYSTDPYNGEVRVNEFKQMVQSLHENDINVVMDVVYNHTGATADSDFNKIVPGYYYRQDANGGFANGSGCGNETASDRDMMRKFMVDSVMYWAQEYNINGFRFDLMALHDIETMNAIEAALKAYDPSIIIYGEGWVGGGTPLPDSEAAYKGNAKQTPGVAYFNDDMRDAVKGNVGNDWEPGYINGDTSSRFYERLQFGIVGSSAHDQVQGWDFWAANPSQSISYVSAHDNNTLYDKLLGVQKKAGKDDSMEFIKKLQKQANAMVMMGQGVPFLHAGVEMMRTKGGDHNSYNKPDEVNQINWDWKYDNYDVVSYYKGLIELRKEHPAFRMMNRQDVQDNLRFDESTSQGILSYTISNHANGDSVSDIAVIHNVNDTTQTVKLGKSGNWSVVVNGEKAGTQTLEIIDGDTVEVTPHSSYVLLLDYEAPEISKDVVAPVITLNGSSELFLTVGAQYKELGATAFDAVDGKVEVVISGTVDTNSPGEYLLTYTATDKGGNKSEIVRRITVREKPIYEDHNVEIELDDKGAQIEVKGNHYTISNVSDTLKQVIFKGETKSSFFSLFNLFRTSKDFEITVKLVEDATHFVVNEKSSLDHKNGVPFDLSNQEETFIVSQMDASGQEIETLSFTIMKQGEEPETPKPETPKPEEPETPIPPTPENPGDNNNSNTGNNNSNSNKPSTPSTNKPTTGLSTLGTVIGIGALFVVAGGVLLYLTRKRKSE